MSLGQCTKSDLFVFAGKAGAKGADSKKNAKKSAVAKPNTIKSLFMNSNVKRPAEVCFYCHQLTCFFYKCPYFALALTISMTLSLCRKMWICPKMTYWETSYRTCTLRLVPYCLDKAELKHNSLSTNAFDFLC